MTRVIVYPPHQTFTFTPSDSSYGAPTEAQIEALIKSGAIQALAHAKPLIVIRWAEVVAVEIEA